MSTKQASGVELLIDWMRRRGYNQREAATALEIDFTQLNQYLKRRRRPELDNAVKIERASGIPVEAWTSSDEDKSDTAEPHLIANGNIDKA